MNPPLACFQTSPSAREVAEPYPSCSNQALDLLEHTEFGLWQGWQPVDVWPGFLAEFEIVFHAEHPKEQLPLELLGLLQHVGKDPELQPRIQVAAVWANSHRSGFLLACLAGSSFSAHGIHLDLLLHMGLKSL